MAAPVGLGQALHKETHVCRSIPDLDRTAEKGAMRQQSRGVVEHDHIDGPQVVQGLLKIQPRLPSFFGGETRIDEDGNVKVRVRPRRAIGPRSEQDNKAHRLKGRQMPGECRKRDHDKAILSNEHRGASLVDLGALDRAGGVHRCKRGLRKTATTAGCGTTSWIATSASARTTAMAAAARTPTHSIEHRGPREERKEPQPPRMPLFLARGGPRYCGTAGRFRISAAAAAAPATAPP